MTRDQTVVAIGAGSGVASMAVAVGSIYQLWPVNSALGETASRLAYALEADAFAALPLLVGIIIVGNDRFLTDAIDPTLHREDRATEINGRVLDNTLQQFVLLLAGTLALSVNLAPDQMRAMPAVAVVFVAARVAFWIGYRIHPLYRAFGMAATIYLNIGITASALWKMLR